MNSMIGNGGVVKKLGCGARLLLGCAGMLGTATAVAQIQNYNPPLGTFAPSVTVGGSLWPDKPTDDSQGTYSCAYEAQAGSSYPRVWVTHGPTSATFTLSCVRDSDPAYVNWTVETASAVANWRSAAISPTDNALRLVIGAAEYSSPNDYVTASFEDALLTVGNSPAAVPVGGVQNVHWMRRIEYFPGYYFYAPANDAHLASAVVPVANLQAGFSLTGTLKYDYANGGTFPSSALLGVSVGSFTPPAPRPCLDDCLNATDNPVKYFDGEIKLAADDLPGTPGGALGDATRLQ